MDWAITLGLMACILVGGTLSAMQVTGGFKKNTPEPFRSQQTMQVGFTWMLASIVPFWRDHPAVAWIALLMGVATLLQGCTRIYRFGKEKARTERVAAEAAVAQHAIVLDRHGRALSPKAAARLRRRTARDALSAPARPSEDGASSVESS